MIFKVPTKLFWWSNKIIFWSVSSKILDLSVKSFFPLMYINDVRIYVNKETRNTKLIKTYACSPNCRNTIIIASKILAILRNLIILFIYLPDYVNVNYNRIRSFPTRLPAWLTTEEVENFMDYIANVYTNNWNDLRRSPRRETQHPPSYIITGE